MPVEEQVISIYAGTNGYLDDLPASDVVRFEQEMLEFFRTQRSDVLGTIRSTKKLPEGDTLADAVREFKARFSPSVSGAGAELGSGTTAVETTPETLETE
jgi:F-type H+-transporting ATPase subunit alpha